MKIPEKSNSARKPRADGERNRAALLEAARRIFAERGSEVSLEEIARSAGVGNGTLYRHFPTRGALIDAVCEDDARALVTAAADLAGNNSSADALVTWMDLFIAHVAAKNIALETVNALIAPATEEDGVSGAEVRDAFFSLFSRAASEGNFRAGFDPLDVLRAVAGIAVVRPKAEWPEDARRFVRIVFTGLREHAPG